MKVLKYIYLVHMTIYILKTDQIVSIKHLSSMNLDTLQYRKYALIVILQTRNKFRGEIFAIQQLRIHIYLSTTKFLHLFFLVTKKTHGRSKRLFGLCFSLFLFLVEYSLFTNYIILTSF